MNGGKWQENSNKLSVCGSVHREIFTTIQKRHVSNEQSFNNILRMCMTTPVPCFKRGAVIARNLK